MTTQSDVLYWKLEPVYPSPENTIRNAAVATCLATGKVVDGSGGSDNLLCNEVVEALRATHGPRVIVNASLLEAADVLNAMLIEYIGPLMNAEEGTPEAAQLTRLADAVHAYEALRWPIANDDETISHNGTQGL